MSKKYFIKLTIFLCILVQNALYPNTYQKILEVAHLTPEQQEICSILALNENITDQKTFSKETIEDFEILKGQHKHEYNLVSRIDNTETSCGYIELAKQLISPCDNIDRIKSHQAIIHEIVENEELFEQLDIMIKEFKQVEPIIQSFFHKDTNGTDDIDLWEEDEDDNEEKEKNYRSVLKNKTVSKLLTSHLLFLPDSTKKCIKKKLSCLDKKPILLEIALHFQLLEELCAISVGLAYSSHIIGAIVDLYKGDVEAARNRFFAEDFGDEDDLLSFCNNIRKSALNMISPFISLAVGAGLMESNKMLCKSIIQTSTDFIALGTFINKTLKETDYLLRKNTNFHEAIPELHEITKIALNSEESKDLKKLLDLFNSSTCRGKPSAIFSSKGRMIAIYQLLKTEKNKLIPMLSAIGKLDALLSVAKLYKKRKTSHARYCFPKYTSSKKSVIIASNFWNPFIDPEIIVTNSISIGNQEKGRCCVFTGPNAAGKSTAMKAIAINAIIAQTCGIAPSENLTLSPFYVIGGHLPNSTEDVASKRSRYVGEAIRIKEILDTLKNLPKDKLFLLIIDELFTSTNSDSGGSIARAIGQIIALNYPNCIAVIASHLSDITEIENDTDGIVKNYRVTIEKEIIPLENGEQKINIIYPYTIEPGIVDQSIAIDILETLGFDKKIIEISRIFYEAKQTNRSHSC